LAFAHIFDSYCHGVQGECECFEFTPSISIVTRGDPEDSPPETPLPVSRSHRWTRHYLGYADDIGQVWPLYTQLLEEGFNSESYLIESFSTDESTLGYNNLEYATARALNGERVAAQTKSTESGHALYWLPADPFCTCAGQWHDAWEECPDREPEGAQILIDAIYFNE
jgi:hypothetical protein